MIAVHVLCHMPKQINRKVILNESSRIKLLPGHKTGDLVRRSLAMVGADKMLQTLQAAPGPRDPCHGLLSRTASLKGALRGSHLRIWC
jgi:hypothetical protein